MRTSGINEKAKGYRPLRIKLRWAWLRRGKHEICHGQPAYFRWAVIPLLVVGVVCYPTTGRSHSTIQFSHSILYGRHMSVSSPSRGVLGTRAWGVLGEMDPAGYATSISTPRDSNTYCARYSYTSPLECSFRGASKRESKS
eukprot:9489158-Pyramimonas_sp.AAC.3